MSQIGTGDSQTTNDVGFECDGSFHVEGGKHILALQEIHCSHRPPCPGCPRWGEAGVSEEVHQKLSLLREQAGLSGPLQVVEGEISGYRHRSRLAVRGRIHSPKIGIFAQGSHQIVDIPRCHVHHPLINKVVAAVKRGIRQCKLQPYIEKSHRGWLRYLQVVVERSSQSAQIVLVGNSDSAEPFEPLARYLWEQKDLPVHSIWWNGNTAQHNAILGSLWDRLYGTEAVCELIGGVSVFFPPGAFGQANLALADEMVSLVAEWIPEQAHIAEFYAGCGSFGLGLLNRGASVCFNEVAPGGLAGLRLGLAGLSEEVQSRAHLYEGPAGDYASLVPACDVVLVDPPRKGLDAALLQSILETPPQRLIYVSCGLDSLWRETQQILESGSMKLRDIRAFALFPYTEHVETLAYFESASQR